ncbi:hypothetical protein [Pseudomonas sp. LP_7_YM]|uniref:hypothetical protein n=1 Tax=Pseudomonas sp. LP_7_YM TaxID=2485137 RepID=UPI00105B45F6|nr:hypothetical protein [Pseudomonas sp. LP_7_YM]TDV60792.1 hypothetical protein EC915_11036 [Pseudomonas sp. LP_7_YM]
MDDCYAWALLRYAPAKRKKAGWTLFSIFFIKTFFLFTPLAAVAGERAFLFHGQLVNAGCDTRLLSNPQELNGLKFLKVNESLSLELISHDDACDSMAVPVSAAYAERVSRVVDARCGIVTLTYQ